MTETFKDIPGYTGYQISNLGRVRSTKYKKPRILKTSFSTTGYPNVRLYENNVGRTWVLHRLVMLAFVGECPDGMCVLHLDGTRTNCELSNLRYGTQSENILQAFAEGTMTNVRKRKLTKEQAVFAKTSPLSAVKVAKLLNVSSSVIDNIRLGVTYKDAVLV